MDVCSAAATYLLAGSVDRTLLFGPVVWRPSDGTASRRWYFVVAGRHQQAGCGTFRFPPSARSTPWRCAPASWTCSPSIARAVCAIFSDELAMAKVAENL